MKQIFYIWLLLWIFGSSSAYAQTTDPCNPLQVYTQKHDGTGTQPYKGNALGALELVAKDLAKTFPAPYCNNFKVFDYGFTPMLQYTKGGYAEAFEAMKLEALGANRDGYYLLFAREVNQMNRVTKIWVDVNLPKVGKFSCMTEMQRSLVKIKVETAVNAVFTEDNDDEHFAEMRGIATMEQQVKKIVDCCANGGREICNLCSTKEDNELYYSANSFSAYTAKITIIDASVSNTVDYTSSKINLVGNVDILTNEREMNTKTVLNDFWTLLEKNNVPHRLIITYSNLKCTLANMNELITAFEDPNIRYAVWINIGENEVSEKIRAPINIELFGDDKVPYESLCYSMESIYTTKGGAKRYENQKWQVSSKLGQVFDNFAAKSQLGYDLLKKYAKKDLKFGNSTFTEDGIYANDNVILEIIDRNGFTDSYGVNDHPKIISNKDGSTILHCGIVIFRDADDFVKEDFQCTLGHELFIHFDIKADNLIGLWRDRSKSTAHFSKFEQYLSKNNSKNGNVDHCGYTNSEAKYSNYNKHINEIKKSKIYDDKLFDKAKKEHDIRIKGACDRGK